MKEIFLRSCVTNGRIGEEDLEKLTTINQEIFKILHGLFEVLSCGRRKAWDADRTFQLRKINVEQGDPQGKRM